MLKQRYRILNKLGQGGMGAVYKAEDTSLGNRLVAIKEMSQHGLDPQEVLSAAQAFKQEAHMLAGLHHPNLPSIHEHFEETGRWYLVMSFIEGETLESYLQSRGGKLQIAEVLEIGIQLCTVLDYLHNRQPPIIFRDLKPLNIMWVSDGHLYLIDFGIARHFKASQTRDTRIGYTPGYAAPEQYGVTQTTPRSDIYSLGATLHQLLSGNRPSHTPFLFAPLRLQGYQNASDLEILISKMVEMDESRRPANMKTIKQELHYIATQRIGQHSHPLPSTGSKPLASSPRPAPAVVQQPASQNYHTPKPHTPPPITPTSPPNPSLQRQTPSLLSSQLQSHSSQTSEGRSIVNNAIMVIIGCILFVLGGVIFFTNFSDTQNNSVAFFILGGVFALGGGICMFYPFSQSKHRRV